MTDAQIGDNNPPVEYNYNSINECREAFDALTDFLKMYPVIDTQDAAESAKQYLDAAKDVIKGAENERKDAVKPWNDIVNKTNAEFKAARTPLEKLIDRLAERLQAFLIKKEHDRLVELELARMASEKAEAAARAAEQAEQAAINNAADGEFTDVGGATLNADAAFAEFEKFREQEKAAEAAANVKVSGGGRNAGLRNVEVLHVEDWMLAIGVLCNANGGLLPPRIDDLICTLSREYRKEQGELPAGVASSTERRL
jgi:hypothetical protein